MAKFWEQFAAVARKNYLLKIRNKKALFFEFFIPLFVIWAMVQLRAALNPSVVAEEIPRTYFATEDMETMLNGPHTFWDCFGDSLLWRCAYEPEDGINPCASWNPTSGAIVYTPEQGKCQRRYVAVAPVSSFNTAAVAAKDEFMSWADTHFAYLQDTVFIEFASEESFEDHIESSSYSVSTSMEVYSAAVIFDAGPPDWTYTLRFNQTGTNWGSREFFPRTSNPDLDLTVRYGAQWPPSQNGRSRPYADAYQEAGAIALGNAVNSFIVTQTCRNLGACGATENVTLTTSGTVAFPSPEVLEEGFWASLGNLFALLFTISLLYPLSNGVKQLVSEKESKMRQVMMIMSLRSDVLALTWALHFLALFLPLSIILNLAGQTLFTYSTGVYIFMYFFMFFASSMSYFGFVSVFFSHPKTASVIGSMSYFLGYLLYVGIENAEIGRIASLTCCLHPATAFTFGTLAFQEWEDIQIGITADTFNTSLMYDITFMDVLVMMFVDVVYLNILTWYFGHIWPSEYGTAKPWYFPVAGIVKRWNEWKNGGHGGGVDLDGIEMTQVDKDIPLPHGHAYLEPASDALMKMSGETGTCVTIKNLSKTFDTRTGPKKAVDSLSLEMYAGQITALLGHNGAGKSTTIAMLTGLTAPDSGTATITGLDLNTDMDSIRESLGVCPQHDVIFDELSVEEHLVLFAAIKGITSEMRSDCVTSMIESVGLTEKRHTHARMLSGGQKRKLSLAIAFLGDSKVIFLDEPTSGMDPYSRRFTWNLIRQQKIGRVIVLTTHFMDEADLLCDRIAIMGEGRLRCCGSSLYLKKNFGVGYNVTLEKATSTHFDSAKLMKIFKKHVADSVLMTNVGTEISVQLPYESVQHFSALFSELDASVHALQVRSYGVSVTTMEEVFLKVARGAFDEAADNGGRVHTSTSTGSSSPCDSPVERRAGEVDDTSVVKSKSEALAWWKHLLYSALALGGGSSVEADTHETIAMEDDGTALAVDPGSFETPPFTKLDPEHVLTVFVRHIRALLWKRWLYFRRDTKAWMLQFLAPVLFLLVGVLVMVYAPFWEYQPERALSIYMYNNGIDVDRMPTPYSAGSRFCTFNESINGNCGGYSSVSDQSLVMTNISDVDLMPVLPQNTTLLQEMSQYLFDTRGDYEASRFGAVSFVGVDFDNGGAKVLSTVDYLVHSNFTAMHGAPLFQSLVADGALRSIAAQAGSTTSYSINLKVHPLPRTARETSFLTGFSSSLLASFCMLAVPYIPAAFALFVVREREIKAKYQQVVSGVSMLAYWLSTWIFDVSTYLVCAAMMVGLMSGFKEAEPLTGTEGFPATVLLFVLFGTSISSFTYVLSYLYSNAAGAQIGLIFIVSLLGLALSILGVFLRIFDDTNDLYVGTIRYFLCVLPPFAFGDGLQSIALRAFFAALEKEGLSTYSVWDWDCAGIDICYMAIFSVVYFVIAVFIDYSTAFSWTNSAKQMLQSIAMQFFGITPFDDLIMTPEQQQPQQELMQQELVASASARDVEAPVIAVSEKDGDVLAEEARVASNAAMASGDTVVVKNVHKTYAGGKRAVRGLSLGIPNGECFGLLGINGAGKSSTIAMLTGEVKPSLGDAFLDGESIGNNVHSCRRKIGFCPQFDAIFELLTGREHLTLYALLKGVEQADVPSVVDAKLKELNLTEHADRVAWGYSGGNKRKLSVAIAMIGEPEIVFLDEPSTGMDPVTRRYMWKVITDIVTRRKSCSMVLTTHSMEEAEALCTRIGVMVGGTMRCLGSTQRLRSLYGIGYQIEVGVKHPEPADISAKEGFLQSLLDKEKEKEKKERLSAMETAQVLHRLCTTPGQTNVGFASPPPTDETSLDSTHCPVFALGPLGCTTIHLASWLALEERVVRVLSFFEARYPGLRVRERQSGKVRLEISGLQSSGRPRPLAELFDLMEGVRDELFIEDYSISQTTLEQIFNSFAKLQREETGHVDGISGFE